ncbi:hypothetical protein [Sphingomonas sp. UV9]|uniref:hypothetical protein n=1 Tax=Sphingomonas sp. UV9 TaxID=1851410 RepID=UPI0019D14033|nr:hypothetical protein [Sphingomonas sp. UV9]
MVQNSLTSFEDDVPATNRVLARRDGATILVWYSYGGSVIREAGGDAKVVGLVYVAAFAPAVDKSMLDQYSKVAASARLRAGDDGRRLWVPEQAEVQSRLRSGYEQQVRLVPSGQPGSGVHGGDRCQGHESCVEGKA